MCVGGGYAAGKEAAVYAGKEKHRPPIDPSQFTAERERVYKPLEKKTGVPYWEFEDIVRIIATDHFGPVKTENSLKSALVKFDRLDDAHVDLKAGNLHELMRVHEAMNIQQVAKITATAALARKETRFPPYHFRADFPDTDDKNFCGLIVVKKDAEGSPSTRFEPLAYDV
jgi:adenylylsulfate reductase subunit A